MGQKIRSSPKNIVFEKPVISSGLLESNMLSDFRYSDFSLEAFLLTAFRTSGNNSECFAMLLAAACQFLSHTCLTKHLVISSWGILTRIFADSVLKTTLTWRLPSGRLSMFRYWPIVSLFSFSDAWSLSCPNSKDFREDFPLFVLVAGDNSRTDLRIGLFPSGVSSKHLFADVDFGGVAAVNSVILPSNDSWTNEYSDLRFQIFRAQGLQTRLECLSHFTTSNPALWRFWAKISQIKKIFCRNITITKFNLDAAIT